MRDYSHAAAVTPDNSNDLATPAWAFITGSNGTVKITTYWGDVVTVTCVAGYVYKIRSKRIWATGTSATNIIALW